MSKDSWYRIGRTFLQTWLGTLILLSIPTLTSIATDGDTSDLTGAFLKKVVFASTAAAVITALTAIQNALEDAWGRSILIPKKDPIVKQ